jgi:hypothetical protein
MSGPQRSIADIVKELRRLRREYTERLLTLLALFLALEMFVFSPLQAMGIFAFQDFVIATLLAIVAGMLIISDHPAAVVRDVGMPCRENRRFPDAIPLGHITSTHWLSLGSPLRSHSEQWSPRLGGKADMTYCTSNVCF